LPIKFSASHRRARCEPAGGRIHFHFDRYGGEAKKANGCDQFEICVAVTATRTVASRSRRRIDRSGSDLGKQGIGLMLASDRLQRGSSARWRSASDSEESSRSLRSQKSVWFHDRHDGWSRRVRPRYHRVFMEPEGQRKTSLQPSAAVMLVIFSMPSIAVACNPSGWSVGHGTQNRHGAVRRRAQSGRERQNRARAKMQWAASRHRREYSRAGHNSLFAQAGLRNFLRRRKDVDPENFLDGAEERKEAGRSRE